MNRMSTGDKIVNYVFYIILFLLCLLCAYPVWYTLVASISGPTYVNSGAFILFPKDIQFTAYDYAFHQPQLWRGYGNTILYTVCGTLLALFTCLPAGYALSRKDLPFRGIIMGLFVFTMYFSGGLIPMYIVCKTLNLLNTRWILILFGSFSVYNIILIRTNFQSGIPEEMREAASIDGCSNTRFFFQFALPLSKAIIAVIALYVAVGYWNNYYNALVYVTDRDKQPLQLYLKQLLTVSIGNEANGEAEETAMINQLSQIVRYAVIVISTAPIMCLYPFLQKYFVQGVMIGSLKG